VATATDTRSATGLLPGSRWRALRGPHAGAVVEVLGINKAGRVRIHTVSGEGKNVGNGHFDEAIRDLKPTDQFLASYTLAMPAPVSQVPLLEQPTSVPTQPAWRKPKRARPPKPAPTPAARSSVVGEINTRDAEFNVSLEAITPDRARAWLDRGGLNRHLNPVRVEALAAAIRRGEWRITGDTIKLDKQGRIRDGQHRLSAIAEGGRTVQGLVVFGVEDEAFDVMDTGRSRTIADILGLHGHTDRNALASAARSLILFDDHKRLVGGRDAQMLVTSASTLHYVQEHPDITECLHLAQPLRMEFPGGSGLWAALLYLFRRISVDQTQVFIDGMLTGAGLGTGHPILVLRNRLMSRGNYWSIRNNADKEALAASIIKTWNGFRAGETFERGWRNLHWRNVGRSAEPFPVPQ
jgi:hypothetical protein